LSLRAKPLENYTPIVNKFLGFVSVVVEGRAAHRAREFRVEFCPDSRFTSGAALRAPLDAEADLDALMLP
jgi:hypothetical protein